MAPVNFLVQPQDLDEINNKLDIVVALLERWDRERQEVNKATLPIRIAQEPSLETDMAGLTKPTQKRKKRPFVTTDEDAPGKQPAKEKKRSSKKIIRISEEEEEVAMSEREETKDGTNVNTTTQTFDSQVPEKPKKLKKKSLQGEKIKQFAQKSDPIEEPEEEDDFVIQKL